MTLDPWIDGSCAIEKVLVKLFVTFVGLEVTTTICDCTKPGTS